VKARVLAGVAVAALGLGVALTPAHGDPTDQLSVYAGRAIATPIGLVSRVPAESAGGVIYTEARLEIGKTRAIAAGETLGELGEAFLITSFQGYTNPTLVNAQYPPSNVYPAEATASNSVDSGGVVAGRFHAVADGSPSAAADASGGAGDIPGALHVGGGTSRSRTEVKSDGTVVTTAASTVHDVGIGPGAAPVLTIGTMTSSAEVEIPFGGKPKTSLSVQLGGVLVAGTPVTITQDGVTIGSTAAVPASSVLAVNQALAQLDAQGISVRAVPVEKQETDSEATVSGAALQLRYIVPPTAQLPTDIGKDETLLLGQVSANATGRPRRPLSLGTPPAEVAPLLVGPELGAGEPAGTGFAPAPLPAPALAPPSAGPAAAGPEPFRLPARSRNVVAERVLSGYRLVVLAAVIAAVAHIIRNRTRLPE
jgi:hypothetical protein